jgi:hypothetical protein
MALFFLTRIELHGATREHYGALHEAMARSGFRRDIVSDQGSRLQLPWAEYAYYGGPDCKTVLELAQTTAGGVWLDLEILVCEVASWWSVGLAI